MIVDLVGQERVDELIFQSNQIAHFPTWKIVDMSDQYKFLRESIAQEKNIPYINHTSFNI